MEQESVERARTRRSSSRQAGNTAYKASPPRARHNPKKRKLKSKPTERYYSVRDILDEQKRGEETYYLIDWDDDQDTGESYTPTWEPRPNVTSQAIAAWEEKKGSETQSSGALEGGERSSTFDSDSETIHRTKRQRVTGEPARQKPSSGGSGREIQDSYETQQAPSTGPKKVLALLPEGDETFDREAYTVYTNISTDPSQISQISKLSQASAYSSPPPEPVTGARARRPFLWDEPAPVVPDSQELPGSSSYIPSERETAPSQQRSTYVSEPSADNSLEYSEESSALSTRNNLIVTPEGISTPPPHSIEESPRPRSSKTSRRPSRLSINFILDDSEAPGDSWQAAQARSPPPRASPELSAPPALQSKEGSSSHPSTQSQGRSAASQRSQDVIRSIEGAEDIAWTQHTAGQDLSGSPLPPRISTPSSSTMADKSTSPGKFAEMLKQARATAQANIVAKQDEARAASATPSTTPTPSTATPSNATPSIHATMQPPPNNMLPLRSTTEAQNIASPSSRNSSESGSTTKALQILPLGPEEYVVPLPLNAITRDIYDGEITNFRQQQRTLLKSDDVEASLVDEIDTMLSRLKVLCDHQDLIRSDYSTQESDPFEVQAAWAENISTKCVFLKSILTLLRPYNTHVALVARPGRMVNILETVLRKENCNYKRSDRPHSSDVPFHGSLRVTLLPSDFYKHTIDVEPAHVVIAFDSTFEKEKYSVRLRDDPLFPGRLAPLVRLTVVRSIEHFELCFDKQMGPIDRRAALVSCVLQSRHHVGVLPSGYLSPPAAAQEVGMFTIAVPADRDWPLRSMPDLEGLEFELDAGDELQPEAQTAEVPDQAQVSETTTESYGLPSAQLLQATFKRSLSADDGDASSKRQRLTPVIDEAPRARRPSNIMSFLNPEPSPMASEPERVQGPSAQPSQANLVSSLEKKVKELELELQRRDASDAELRDQNQQLESRCADLEKSIQAIQPKYQEALNDRDRFEHEMKEASARSTTLQQRIDARIAELAKLKEQKTASDAELEAARSALAGSAIPEVAELSRLKEEAATSRAEIERLNKRITSMQSELEYMRTNYQQASSAAADAVSELNDVKAELAAAEVKASDNARRIHEVQASSEIKHLLLRIRELEAEKAEAEWELEKKSDELKAMLNGRRATRGTSVPRSPRMGTMSPGSRPMARVLSVGSRGNSPAPGDGPPYRGTFAGEALFTTAPPASRFGNHLM